MRGNLCQISERRGLLGDGTCMEPPHAHWQLCSHTHAQLGRQTSAVLHIFEDFPPSLQCSAGTVAEPLRAAEGGVWAGYLMLSPPHTPSSAVAQVSCLDVWLLLSLCYCVVVLFIFPATILHDILPHTNIHPSLMLSVIEKHMLCSDMWKNDAITDPAWLMHQYSVWLHAFTVSPLLSPAAAAATVFMFLASNCLCEKYTVVAADKAALTESH